MKPILDRLLSMLYGIFAISVGIAAGWYGQEFVHGNDKARDVIVTVFSILAGFLIAIMTLMGDQSTLPGSWRIAKAQAERIRLKLIRQKWLFYFYLTTLALIFLHTLIATKYPEIGAWVERVYFGFAVSSFILSFKLPSTLMAVQTDRIDAVVGARRDQASKLDRN